jgi:hypothetical protein
MSASSKSAEADPVVDALAYKLQLMLDRWRIANGRLIVAYPDAALWWLDKEIEEMEAGQ